MIYQRQRDSGARLEIQTTRRLRKLNRVPAWADVPAMRRVYEESRRRRDAGEDVQVDHIVPLKSELVSGLHVPANLQIIDTEWNRIKANEWWPDMP
jgi:hypothetical protein